MHVSKCVFSFVLFYSVLTFCAFLLTAAALRLDSENFPSCTYNNLSQTLLTKICSNFQKNYNSLL